MTRTYDVSGYRGRWTVYVDGQPYTFTRKAAAEGFAVSLRRVDREAAQLTAARHAAEARA